MPDQSSAGKIVGATDRTLDILEALEELDGGGVTEIAEHLGYTPSSVYSHLNTLLQREYVVKEDDIYYLGLKFLDLGAYSRNRKDEYKQIQPYVDDLAQETGEVASFIVEEHGKAVFVHRETGDHAPHTTGFTGKRSYLHALSAGKAILAHLPDEKVEDVIATHGLPKETPNTIADEQVLFAELDEIVDRGYAFNKEENIQGLRAVGVPILTEENEVIGALSISGPTKRMKGKWYNDDIPDLLLGTANEIELNITYSG